MGCQEKPQNSHGSALHHRPLIFQMEFHLDQTQFQSFAQTVLRIEETGPLVRLAQGLRLAGMVLDQPLGQRYLPAPLFVRQSHLKEAHPHQKASPYKGQSPSHCGHKG
uniref:Uncharacterized protein n=1 Tax=uncultured marine virus TaxID=186617 RepID=A0A0F7L7T9_9VIRU|nr:hypothetical protein [uncultured marine virus]